MRRRPWHYAPSPRPYPRLASSEIDDGEWHVDFGPLRLGRFHERARLIEDALGSTAGAISPCHGSQRAPRGVRVKMCDGMCWAWGTSGDSEDGARFRRRKSGSPFSGSRNQ